jgi:hypothetical protein
MATKKTMTTAQEARFRLRCVRKKTPDGYGDPNCLRKFAEVMVRRVNELQGLVDEWDDWSADHELKDDPDIVALVEEHAELLGLLVRIDKHVGLNPGPRPKCWEVL